MNDRKAIELSKLEFPLERFIKAGYNTIQPNANNKRNGYSDTMYYIISGELDVEIDGHIFNCKENSIIHLSKEDKAILINPSKNKKTALYYMLFDLKKGITMKDMCPERVISDVSEKIRILCKQIYKTHLSEGMAYKLKVTYEFSELLYEFITHKFKQEEKFSVNYKLSKAVQHIRMNYYKNISVEELAEISGYSVSHFRKLFVSTYGVSPQEYMINYKIRKAKEMLMEDEGKSMDEIAELLGMCNASYFCRIFKKKVGITPYKYTQK